MMKKHKMPSMAYVQQYGQPDLFITFTCNSAWKEVKEELMERKTPQNRNDMLACVLQQNQMKLLDFLNNAKIFGQMKYFMTSNESQKRGLPHSHTLLRLREDSNRAD